jgi:hypothetical protein
MSAPLGYSNAVLEYYAGLAAKQVTRALAREAVSTQIGHAVAFALGALTFRYLGWLGVALLAAGYLFSARIAYRRWRQLR